MAREKEYRTQLESLGVWREPFTAAVHELCILEREQSRARKEWKASAAENEAPSVTSPIYQVILTQGRDIAKLRESLGLTPNGLKRLLGAQQAVAQPAASADALSQILDSIAGDVHG